MIMSNYHILNGIPQEALNMIQYEWESVKDNLKDNPIFSHYISVDEYQDFAVIDATHKLHDIVKSFIDIPYNHIMFLISNGKSGLGPVHIDAGRECAINIPIEVDFINSCFFIANQECTERPFHDGEPVSEGTKRFLYEPERYDYYNMRKPILINTKQPHGFFNHAPTTRVVFSISFIDKPYTEVMPGLVSNGSV
tara:strand:+ start:3915 stop:4499 length:585 start_codon:yes stop_codon:yes gene_type:complete